MATNLGVDNQLLHNSKPVDARSYPASHKSASQAIGRLAVSPQDSCHKRNSFLALPQARSEPSLQSHWLQQPTDWATKRNLVAFAADPLWMSTAPQQDALAPKMQPAKFAAAFPTVKRPPIESHWESHLRTAKVDKSRSARRLRAHQATALA